MCVMIRVCPDGGEDRQTGASNRANRTRRYDRGGLHLFHRHKRQIYGERTPQNPERKRPDYPSGIRCGIIPLPLTLPPLYTPLCTPSARLSLPDFAAVSPPLSLDSPPAVHPPPLFFCTLLCYTPSARLIIVLHSHFAPHHLPPCSFCS